MALTTIPKELIVADAIDATKIADDAIDSEHYADVSIDTAHIAASQVTTAKIAADAITGAKIADDAIDSEHYVDGSIDTAHIADDAITAAKIVAGAVIADVANDSIDSQHYVAASIDNEHLADDAVGIAELSATGTASSSTFLRGDNAWTAVTSAAIATYGNAGNNRIITSVDSDEVTSETNLTFDGSTLQVTGGVQVTPSSGENIVLTRDSGGPVLGTTSNHSLRLITNNAERMRITSAGAVTIGGTLGVTGIITANSSSSGDYVRMYGSAGTGKWDIYGSGANLRISDNESAGLVDIDTALNVDGAVTVGGTLGVTGVLTANAGVVVDNFTLDGVTLALSSGNLTLDSAGDIYLDAGGGDITLLDDGTHLGTIKLSSSAFRIDSQVPDQDITFTGNDGGSAITAMTIDMSAGGAVGIGTTSPDQKLSLKGAGPGFRIESSTNSTSRTWDLATETVAGGDLAFRYGTSLAAAPSVTSLILKGDGKIGIGVTDPDCRLEVGGTDAMSAPSGTTAQRPTARNGMMRYNSTENQMECYENGSWKSFDTTLYQPTVEFIRPSTSNIKGTLSNNNQTWSAGGGYSGVSTNINLEGNFQIITSWQHDYMGVGFARKADIDSATFTGESDDGNGFYMGSAAVDGFDSSVTFVGGYHFPSGQGATTEDDVQYIMHERVGNAVKVYQTENSGAATDPDHSSWVSQLGTTTVGSSDHIKPGWGEAGGTQNQTLRILYTSVTGGYNFD